MAFVTSLPVSAAGDASSFAQGGATLSSSHLSRCPATAGSGAGADAAAGAAAAAAAPRAPPARRATMMAAAGAGASPDDVPDMKKRITMNVLLGGAVGGVVLGAGVPFVSFFVPKQSGAGSGGVIAKDALGNDVSKAAYLQTHQAGSRELVQGLKGDATYLIVNDTGDDLEYYALNAVCTHLGCVVPWNRAQNKFMCPCHGSQYSKTGAVVRGPAPLPLALERVEEDESGNVVLKSWGKDLDFRTNEAPWWNF